jgi:hypothetical protein
MGLAACVALMPEQAKPTISIEINTVFMMTSLVSVVVLSHDRTATEAR